MNEEYLRITKDGDPIFPQGYIKAVMKLKDGHRPILKMALNLVRERCRTPLSDYRKFLFRNATIEKRKELLIRKRYPKFDMRTELIRKHADQLGEGLTDNEYALKAYELEYGEITDFKELLIGDLANAIYG